VLHDSHVESHPAQRVHIGYTERPDLFNASQRIQCSYERETVNLGSNKRLANAAFWPAGRVNTGRQHPGGLTLLTGRQSGDIAATAIHLMVSSAVTGATYDVDGGEQLIS
jgi:hypothetical protein